MGASRRKSNNCGRCRGWTRHSYGLAGHHSSGSGGQEENIRHQPQAIDSKQRLSVDGEVDFPFHSGNERRNNNVTFAFLSPSSMISCGAHPFAVGENKWGAHPKS
ncbi:hypothetical protein NPIL_424821 [Nephila pilipes]|uniref:Uncharacterized protein n=1 Tax=Nephila pilipes TaxID=299642 RepID=A0A8X6UN34_NEPPI|nr:hypothetical protein NPIL_424821 [Nephila pilipes]